jgi:hypothetical protein
MAMQIRNSDQVYTLESASFGTWDDAQAILHRLNSDTWCGFAPRSVYCKALTVVPDGQAWKIVDLVWQTAHNSPFPAVAFSAALIPTVVPPVEKKQ